MNTALTIIFSEKHLNRYVPGFAGRFNIREPDTVNRMAFNS